MRPARFVLLLSTALAATACGGWTQAHRDNAVKEFKSSTLPSTAAVMHCSEDQLELRLLPEDAPFPKRALVTGCGATASYVKVGSTWVMESGPGK